MIWSIIVGGVIGWLEEMKAGKGGELGHVAVVGGGNTAMGLVARNSLGSFLIGVGGACVVILICRWLFK